MWFLLYAYHAYIRWWTVWFTVSSFQAEIVHTLPVWNDNVVLFIYKYSMLSDIT